MLSKLTLQQWINSKHSKSAKLLAGAKFFAKSRSDRALSLMHLDISRNAIFLKDGDEVVADTLACFADSLKHHKNVRVLNIADFHVDSNILDVLTASLESFKNLQVLCICHSSIGSTGMKTLAWGLIHCTQIHELNISNNQIGNDGATALADILKYLNRLCILDISNNCIERGATVFNALRDYNKYLGDLNISGNPLECGSIEKLVRIFQQLRTIRALRASGIKLGSEGAKSLASGLKFCFSLQTLYINSNDIGPDGALAIADTLKFCMTLYILDISDNPIGVDGADAFADIFKYCANLQELNVSHTNIKSGCMIHEALKHCHQLRKFDISETYFIAPALSIAQFPASLFELSIKKCSLEADDIKTITNVFVGLHSLNVSFNSIGDDGVVTLADALRKNSRLHTLNINNCKIGTKGATSLAESLQHCTSLTSLDISSNLFGPEEIEILKQSLTHCIKLKY